ncbi:MAG TPA: YggS family pyridoxal phosphate-dependent enzyme [Solirubrobacteraceae bacterium]|nr:YggS family pyridoxal phosphate-dependent enzyme [Solirubrobacteraceae bacterium]
MAQLIHGVQVERVRANLAAVSAEIAAAAERSNRDPQDVELLAACKYISEEDLPLLAEAGIALLGENRARELQQKVAAHGELFKWDFIGALQSKHVRAIVPHVRMIHSLASDSALRELERCLPRARPGLRVLVEVNLAGEAGKSGVTPERLGDFLARSPIPVSGLMTMPPLVAEPGQSRRWFRALRELAAKHGLRELSMGTTQDFAVAVEEGATIVRIGTRLYS